MSYLPQFSLDDLAQWTDTVEPDYTPASPRSSQQPENDTVPTLTALAGRHMIREAHLFFEELQASFSSIDIEAEHVDEIWCLLDWHRYILAVWAERSLKVNDMLENKWVDIKESWEVILRPAISLYLRHTDSSKEKHKSNRPVSTDGLSFETSLVHEDNWQFLTQQDQLLIESIIAPSCKKAWNAPLAHEIAFEELIAPIIDNLDETQSSEKAEMDRYSNRQSSEMTLFIRLLQKEIKQLIALSPATVQNELNEALARVLKTALLGNDHLDNEMKYIQFYHALVSSWPFEDPELQLMIDGIFQERVQNIFGRIISPSWSPPSERSYTYTVKDVEDIIALGADIRGKAGHHEDCVLWAAADSDISIQVFEALVHAGAPYSNQDEYNSSPLQAAARVGNFDIVTFLLSCERHHLIIDINDSDWMGNTALHDSAGDCKEKIVDLLLQQTNISANSRAYRGYTPFLRAIEAPTGEPGKYAVIRRFLRSKSVNCELKTTSSSNALHLAAGLRDATLKIVIKHVRDVNAQDHLGDTPLHKAVESNSKSNIATLLKHGADPTIINNQGFTPLMLACHKRHLGPMEILLSLPSAFTRHCEYPIREIDGCYDIEHWSLVTFVLRDLSCAGRKRLAHVGLVLKVILAAKPDLEVRDDDGCSVLNRVVGFVNEHMLEDLLQAGADPNSQDNRGRTPLHRMTGSYSSARNEKVKLLLERGADLNLKDMNGTPAITVEWEQELGHSEQDVLRLIKQCRKLQQEWSLQALAE